MAFNWIFALFKGFTSDGLPSLRSSQISSDQRKKSHKHELHKKKKDSLKTEEHSEKDSHVKIEERHHKEHKKFVSPPKRNINSGDNKGQKEENDIAKRKTESDRVKSDIVSKAYTERVLDSKRKETPKMTLDSDVEKNAAETGKTEISSASDKSETEHKRKVHYDRKERKEISSRKTKVSHSPIFNQTSCKSKSKTKSSQKHCKSSSSDSGSSSIESEIENIVSRMENKTVKNDINKSAIVQETESSNSSSDILANNDEICNNVKVSPVVKPCEIALSKFDDEIESRGVDWKDSNKKTVEDTVTDLTEIPETQMSPSSSSSSDLPVFKDSPIESDNDITVIACDKSVQYRKYTAEESKDKNERNEIINSTLSTEETQVYSCTDPVLNPRNTSKTKRNENETFDSVTKGTNPNECDVKIGEETGEVDNKFENVLKGSSKQQDCAVSPSGDKGQTYSTNALPLNKCLSPQDKIKQSFKSFQSKLMKYQQKHRKERKLKSKIITKKLQDRGLLSEKDETGVEGDIEDNLVVESLSDSDDSDVEILTMKNKNVQKEVPSLNLGIKENEKLDDVEKNDIQTLEIQSMSENEDSDISVLGKPKENNKTSDKIQDKSVLSDPRKDNKILNKKSDKFLINRPMEDKIAFNKLSDRSILCVRDDDQNLNIQAMSESENSDASLLNKPIEGTRTLIENSDKAVSIEPKDHIRKSLLHPKESSDTADQHIDKTTAHIEPQLNNMEAKGGDIKIKVEQNDKNDDVKYESFTSASCSQCSSSSDVETEKENVIILGQEEIKTEKEDVNISNIEGYRQMSTHGTELQTGQYLRKNEGSNEVQTNETEENKDKKPILSNLISNQAHYIKQEIEDIELESNTNLDVGHVKDEQVQIKDEPDWSKYSYTQEPDAIFVSDSEDNGNEIMSAQNETILVNSDSDNDNTLTHSQSAYDSQVLDPEFWDFSSPDICSSSEDDVKPIISSKAKKQVDKNVTSRPKEPTRNIYNMETQIDYESQGTTDISLISLTDSDHPDARKRSEKDGEETHLIQKDTTHSSSNKTADATKVKDDRYPVELQVSSNKDKEKDNKLNSIKEKLKLSLSKKKTIEIPMQKTNSWKMARQLSNSSSIVTSTSKRNDSSSDNASESVVKNILTTAPKQPSKVKKPLDDIAFYNAKKSDMWLSKNTSKSLKSPPKPPGKRKRRATGEAEKGATFTSSIQEARKRLADRNYQTVLHPETKADPQKKPKLDRPAELEDVDLPSCSQIVSKGLPILNQTGLLVKKNKPQHQASSRFSSRSASLTETMMETAAESAAKHQTTETGSGSSAFEFLEKEISNLRPVGSDKSEKDKISSEKVEDPGTQRKRRLSTVSQKSEYMPDPKTSKKQTNDGFESIPGASQKAGVSEPSASGSNSCASVKQGVHQPKTDRRSSKEEDHKPGDSTKPKTDGKIKTYAGVSEKPGASKPKTDRNSSKKEDFKSADSARRKDSDRNKTIEKAAKMTDITNVPNEKPAEPKSKPVWTASSVEKQAQKKTESTGREKAKKKVTFGENIRYPTASTSKGPDTSKGPNTSQKPFTNANQRDPRPTKQPIVDRPNLMLKTSMQSSDTSRTVHPPGTTHPQPRPPPPQPIQRQNQVPAPSTSMANQVPPPVITGLTNEEKGISFKEFLAVMLRWNPVWFEEHATLLERDRNSEPPNCINGLPGEPTLLPLVEKYSSFKEYSNNFMVPLLLYETWESCFQTWRERKGRNNIAKHQMCLGGVNDAGDKLNDFVFLGLLTEGQKRQNQFFTEGDLVMLKVNGTMTGENNLRQQTMLGLVERVFMKDTNVNQICSHNLELAKKRRPDSFSVKVILKTRKRKFSPDYKTLGELTQVGSVVTTLRQFRALECLPRNPLCRDILWPTNNDTYCDVSTRTKSQTSFNPSQQKAIMTAALMVSQPSHKPKICLLQGPPGTGKSHTILGIINQILEDKHQKARICLCAQSHAAIDELLRRLSRQNKQLKEKNLSTVKLVRVGKPSSVHEDVRHLCLENLVEKNVKAELFSEKQKKLPKSLLGEKEALEKKIQAVRAEIRNSPDLKKKKLGLDLQKMMRQKEDLDRKFQVDISRERSTPETVWKVKTNLIGKANGIAGTLSGIGSSALKQFFEGSGKEKGRQGFDCIIIDEATQAIELDTLIPLQYGTTKLILVGDPEQLPPTVVSQVAVDNRFNLSMFERLNSHFRYSSYNPVIMLDTQYRMDPEICSFPSNYIYDGKLKTDRSIYGRSQCPLEPYLLYDIADGREQLSQCSGSVSNPAEALFTVSLVEFIVENTNVTGNVIGIIAPYQKQKSLLVTHLQDSSLNGLHEIEVSTVDSFQGREKHVIIMSCVRAKSSTGTIGFVGNRNRMNVALTRAKYALYVIAHFDSLEKHDEWKPLIEDANTRNRRIPVTERNVSFALAKCLKRSHRPP